MPPSNRFSYYRMARGWMEHPMFGRPQPLCRQAAWAWCIEHACWKNRRVNIKGKTLTLRRGQLVASQRYLAKAWRWSRPKVERYLCVLRAEQAIETGTEAGETILTICNYEKYQLTPNQAEPATDPATEPGASQHRARTVPKENKGKEGNEGNGSVPYGTAGGGFSPGQGKINLAEVVFNECLDYLIAHGVKEPQGRSLLGRWRRDYGAGNTIEIVADASEKSVSEPISWITAALRKRHGDLGTEVGPL